MTTALPTAPAGYGLKGPSATVPVDNATPQGATYQCKNSVQTNGTTANPADALPILDPLHRQLLELDRVCLFRCLHFLPSKSDVNSMSPLADEISGEAQPAAS